MTQEQKDRAKKLFETSDFNELFMNYKGGFFTNKNFADLSVMNEKDEKNRVIETVTRADVLTKSTNTAPKAKLIITAADNTKLCFHELEEGDTPKTGDKAKIGKKNAEGVIKLDPQTSYKFEKGELKEIITETKE